MGINDIDEDDFNELVRMAEKGHQSDHRRAFERAGRAKGIPDDRLDDAWSLSKGDLDLSGDPDDRAMGRHVSKFLEGRPHFGEAGGQGEGPGEAGQGEAAAGPAGQGWSVDRANLNNAEWMRANGARFNKESAAGTIRFHGTPGGE